MKPAVAKFCRRVLLLASCAASLALGQALPADIDPVSKARLPYVQRKDTDESAKRLFDVFVRNSSAPTDVIKGPLAFAAYNPAVATALLDLHDAAVGKGKLDAHVRELAILVACRATNYHLEWAAHEPAAVRAGVPAAVIDIVRQRGAVDGLETADATVIRFGRELFDDRKVSAATFAAAKQLFGAAGTMDLVAVMNTYAVSGFFAIAVDEQPAEGSVALP
jgi:4-carboxymuconolactone decarboxylase